MDDDPAAEPDRPPFADRLQAFATGELPPRTRESHRVAAATRRIIHGLVGSEATEDELRDAADRLEAVAAGFDDRPQRSMHDGFAESANAGEPMAFFDLSPVLGRSNPLAPPLALRIVDDRTMEGTGRYGAAYEGPPGCVHGGYIAAAFDDVLGSAQSFSGQPGMTGRLTISYRSPTPLHQELRFTGRFDKVEGRKIFTSGTLHVGDRLCAEAEALFITVDFARLAELERARQQGTPGP